MASSSAQWTIASQVADVCCNDIIPNIEHNTESWKDRIFKERWPKCLHLIRAFIISHNIHSAKMGAMSKKAFSQTFRDFSTGIGNGATWPDLLFDHLKEKAPAFPLSWSTHMVEAVRHEMYPVMATSLQAAISNMQQASSFDPQSVDAVIKSLKLKKSLTNTEIQYFRKLVQRAAGFDPNVPTC